MIKQPLDLSMPGLEKDQWKLVVIMDRPNFKPCVAGKGGGKDLNSRVALDRVGVAVDAGGARLCHAALEEGVAVGVGLFGGTDVSVERVGGRADGQLLRSHWLGCQVDKAT